MQLVTRRRLSARRPATDRRTVLVRCIKYEAIHLDSLRFGYRVAHRADRPTDTFIGSGQRLRSRSFSDSCRFYIFSLRPVRTPCRNCTCCHYRATADRRGTRRGTATDTGQLCRWPKAAHRRTDAIGTDLSATSTRSAFKLLRSIGVESSAR